jgi:hypothetical protein
MNGLGAQKKCNFSIDSYRSSTDVNRIRNRYVVFSIKNNKLTMHNARNGYPNQTFFEIDFLTLMWPFQCI